MVNWLPTSFIKKISSTRENAPIHGVPRVIDPSVGLTSTYKPVSISDVTRPPASAVVQPMRTPPPPVPSALSSIRSSWDHTPAKISTVGKRVRAVIEVSDSGSETDGDFEATKVTSAPLTKLAPAAASVVAARSAVAYAYGGKRVCPPCAVPDAWLGGRSRAKHCIATRSGRNSSAVVGQPLSHVAYEAMVAAMATKCTAVPAAAHIDKCSCASIEVLCLCCVASLISLVVQLCVLFLSLCRWFKNSGLQRCTATYVLSFCFFLLLLLVPLCKCFV